MADPNAIRSQAILKDIYARHGIDPAMPADRQAAAIEESAARRGMLPSGWANPEERAQARAAYAAKGKTDREKEDRWGKSAYLLDPDTYKWQQEAGRDIDFLTAMNASANSGTTPRTAAAVGAAGGTSASAYTPESSVAEALAYWDSSNGSPLFRQGIGTSDYQSQGGVLQGLTNATTNPDVPAANYLNFSEVIPDWMRMWGSGEADTGKEAYEAANAKRMATNRYRLASPSPVLDLPGGADPVEKANRIAELQGLTQSAGIPAADQRWARWTKQNTGQAFVPPGFVTDTLDFATSYLDPTALVPVGATAAGAAGIVAKGAKGLTRPLLAGLAKTRAKDAAFDMGTELGVGHGISGAVGGTPGRSWSQYLTGNWKDPTQKSEEDVAASRQARTQLYGKLKDDDRVSRADSEAYKGLGLRVHVPYPYR